jgi:uncharacterized membrane protein
MVLKLRRLLALFALVLIVSVSTAPDPVQAHKEHNQSIEQSEANELVTPRVATPGAMHEMMEEHAAGMEQQRPTTFGARLVRWLGQMHPFAVHFPIALFPVAWLSLILARRRGEAVPLIRALVIVAGSAAVLAAVLGWLSASFGDIEPDRFLAWHRWIGTGLAVLGGLTAAWAWLRVEAVQMRAMVWLLGAATLVLLVQGWLGAVLVHGMEHMAF